MRMRLPNWIGLATSGFREVRALHAQHSLGRGLQPTKSLRRSLDHLVGAREQRRPHIEAEGFGCLEVDHQFILGRCLHRQVGRLLAPEDAVDVAGGAPELVDQISAIRD
jgi:hypothetical protein